MMLSPKNSPHLILTMAVLAAGPLSGQTLFTDDFESYAVGEVPAWDGNIGGNVVDETTMELFGSPNKAMQFNGGGQKLMKDVAADAVGGVVTFAADIVESAEGSPTSGLVVGYGMANEINTDNAAARVEMRNGTIYQNTIGGMSTITQKGTITYDRGVVNRLFIVANDTDQPLTDYAGDEDLAAGSYEIWIQAPGTGMQQVLEATLARDPEYAGFRVWNAFDDSFFIDNVQIDSGVSFEVIDMLQSALVPGTMGVLSGATINLDYMVEEGLPEGSTYYIASDGDVAFPGGDTGPASTSGQFAATVTGGNREEVHFTLELRDGGGDLVSTAYASVVVFNYDEPPPMVHPSVTSTAGQLEQMRNLVLNYPGSVARAGWEAMLKTSYASLNYTHNPQETVLVVPSGGNDSEAAFRNDSAAARCHALQWVVTGNPIHRDIALAILNDWGHTFRDMQSTGSAAQVELESAWALPVWLGAADILRYHDGGSAGWDPQDMAAFNYFMEALYRKAAATLHRDNNWGASASLAVMAYGAWVGDESVFLAGLDNQIVKLDNISEPDGQIYEVCRDTWHPQYTVVTWGDSAELALNQGYDDLYQATFDGQSTPRLVIVLEYFANLMLGNIPAPCEAGWAYDYLGQYDRFDNYEVPYNHYINREGRTDMPVFKEMVEDYWRQDVGDDAHFLLWSRLTQGTDVLDANGDPVPWSTGILEGYPASPDRWVYSGPLLGWVNDAGYPWVWSFPLGYFQAGPGTVDTGFWAWIPR